MEPGWTMASSWNEARRSVIDGVVRTWLIGLAFSIMAAPSWAACRLPGHEFHRTDSGTHVSLPAAEFTLANLVCLYHHVKELPNLGPVWEGEPGSLLVFDVPWAAAFFTVRGMGREQINNDSDAHALAEFFIDRKTGAEELHLRPFGWAAGPERGMDESIIDLSQPGRPRCRREFQQRCLLAVRDRGIQDEAIGVERARLTWSGRVRPDGTLSNLRLESTQGVPAADRDRLVRATRNHARGWWFEPATRTDRIRVTFALGDAAREASSPADLQLEFSHYVTITADPIDRSLPPRP